MFRNVVEDYLKSVSEINFYILLQFLLESKEYYDIHFTHGIVEMGKDFICKKDGKQYAVVVKVGDINVDYFRRDVRPQILQAVTERTSHPNFNSKEYDILFITTGRISSPAQSSFSELNRYLKEKLHENPVIVWDFDTLIQDIYAKHIEHEFLSRRSASELGKFFGFISRIQSHQLIEWYEIEEYSRTWMHDSGASVEGKWPIIEASLFLELFNKEGFEYLALLLLINLFRAACKDDNLAEYRIHIKNAIVKGFCNLADKNIAQLRNGIIKKVRTTEFIFFAYQRLCLCTAEVLAVAYLLTGRKEYIENLVYIVRTEPGCSRPLSDNYMVTVFVIALALAKSIRRHTLRSFLINTTVWICDRYKEMGLSHIGSSQDEEIEQLLSEYLDGYRCMKNSSSTIGSALLFVAFTLGEKHLFSDIANDLKAVEIILHYYHIPSDEVVYSIDSNSISESFDAEFLDEYRNDYSRPLSYEIANSTYQASLIYLFLSMISFRDRFFPSLIRKFLKIDNNLQAT